MSTDLADRYGTAVRWRRPTIIAVTAAVAAVSLGWLGWAMWFHTTPSVSSSLLSFEVTSDHQMQARIDVRLDDGVKATCRLRAFAEDHTPVGELAFTPVGGVNDVVIRTERRATTVEKLGCTADGQPRPR